MSLFLSNIPQAPDNLDFSQGQLLSNNQGLDTVFGIDHYKFSDATDNKGFHNTVTTPGYVATPSTGLPPVSGANPIFYGFQQTVPLGLLQYSEGPNGAVPSPVTTFQSSLAVINLAPGTTTNLLDFTGIPAAIVMIYAFSVTPLLQSLTYATWNGTDFIVNVIVPTPGLQVINDVNILQIKNTSASVTVSGVRWTMQFLRLT